MPLTDTIITVTNLCKSFGEKPVLRNVNVSIPRGQITVIIGGSGSGKSVLIKHMIGLLKPDSGTVMVDQDNLSTLTTDQLIKVRSKFGMLFQMAALFDSMTVENNVAFPLREHSHEPEAAVLAQVNRLLALLKIPDTNKLMPSDLSGGMRKRVGLARALIMKPRIMIYDEPTTGLDPIMIKQVDDMIQTAAQTNPGLTSVVISHDMASTFRIADQIVMLWNGEVLDAGTPEAMVKSKVPQVQEFLEAAYASPKKTSASAT